MPIVTDGLAILPSIVRTVQIRSAENILDLVETDQVDPAGRWRFRANGNKVYFEKATAASWGNYDSALLMGSLGATCFVVASNAKDEVRNFAKLLEHLGYPVWTCTGSNDGAVILAAAAEGDVYLSEGTFYINPMDLPNNTWIRGAGIDKTILICSDTTGNYGAVEVGNKTNVYVSNLTIRKTGETGAYDYAIAIYNAADDSVVFEKVKATTDSTDNGAHAITIWSSSYPKFIKCHGENTSTTTTKTGAGWYISGTAHPTLIDCTGNGAQGSGTNCTGLSIGDTAYPRIFSGTFQGGGTGSHSDGIKISTEEVAPNENSPLLIGVLAIGGGGNSNAGIRHGRRSQSRVISSHSVGGTGSSGCSGTVVEDDAAPVIDGGIHEGCDSEVSYGIEIAGGSPVFNSPTVIGGAGVSAHGIYLSGNNSAVINNPTVVPRRWVADWSYDDADNGRFRPFDGHPYQLVRLEVYVANANAGVTLDIGTSVGGSEVASSIDLSSTGFKRVPINMVELASGAYLYATPSAAISDGDVTIHYAVILNYSNCNAVYVYTDDGYWRIAGGFFQSNGASDCLRLQQDTGATEKHWRIDNATFETLDPTNQYAASAPSPVTAQPIYGCNFNTALSNITLDAIPSTRSNWVKTVRKTANETVNNSSTLQDDDALLFPVGTSEEWAFEIVIYFTSNNTADFKAAITVPNNTTLEWAYTYRFSGGAAVRATVVSTSGSALGVDGVGDGSYMMLVIKGYVKTTDTAGNVTLQWAQDTADASDTVVKAGSHLIARRIS